MKRNSNAAFSTNRRSSGSGSRAVLLFGAVTAPAALAAALLASGCASRGRVAEQIAVAREESARTWPSTLSGEEATSISNLTLDAAIALAIEQNRTLVAARMELLVAKGRLLESYAAAGPNVSAHAGYTRLDDVSTIPIGNASLSLGFVDNYSADVTLRQPIFHGSAIPAALCMGTLWTLMSEESLKIAEQAVIFDTVSAYCDARLASEIVGVQQQAVAFAEALLKDLRRKKDAGVATEYDVLRAEVELSNARAELLRASNALSLAVNRLAKALGIRDDGALMPADQLIFRKESQPSVEDAVKTALCNRPELKLAQMQIRFQEEVCRATESSRWPSLDGFFTQKWANPDPHSSTSDEWGDAWTAGIAVSFPLWDTAIDGKIRQERTRLKQTQVRLLEQEESIALDVRQAVFNLQNATELVESQQLNLRRAEEGLRLVMAGFASNTKTQLDVMDAQTALTRTRALYYQALHSHMTAVYNLKRALGVLSAGTK